MDMDFSHLKVSFRKTAGPFAVMGAIGSAVADILSPIASIVLYTVVISALFLVALLLAYFWQAKIRQQVSKGITASAATLVCSGIVWLFQMSSDSPQTGYLASVSSAIANVQARLGVMSDDVHTIRENTTVIVEQGKEIKNVIVATESSMRVVATQLENANVTMVDMATSIKQLTQTGGLVQNPSTPADYYHNARILSQRGETDNALESFRKLFSRNIPFLDPVDDLLALLELRYGSQTGVVVEEIFSSAKESPAYQYAKVLTNGHYSNEVADAILSEREARFPVLVGVLNRTLATIYETTIYEKRVLRKCVALLKSRQYQRMIERHYADPNRGKNVVFSLTSAEAMVTGVMEDQINAPVRYRLPNSVQFTIYDLLENAPSFRVRFYGENEYVNQEYIDTWVNLFDKDSSAISRKGLYIVNAPNLFTDINQILKNKPNIEFEAAYTDRDGREARFSRRQLKLTIPDNGVALDIGPSRS